MEYSEGWYKILEEPERMRSIRGSKILTKDVGEWERWHGNGINRLGSFKVWGVWQKSTPVEQEGRTKSEPKGLGAFERRKAGKKSMQNKLVRWVEWAILEMMVDST